jgi:hypothetical protein
VTHLTPKVGTAPQTGNTFKGNQSQGHRNDTKPGPHVSPEVSTRSYTCSREGQGVANQQAEEINRDQSRA